MAEKIIYSDTVDQTGKLFGSFDTNVRLIELAFDVKITNRDTTQASGDAIVVKGEETNVELAAKVLTHLKNISRLEDTISEQRVEYVIGMVRDGTDKDLGELDDESVCLTIKGKPIKAKTVGQRRYVDKIKKNTIVFGVGPAGTGKTFLAVAMAVTALRSKSVSRIILTRPAVEAGEKLGYLPGDLQTKIDPYLRPLYDALFEMLGGDNYARYIEKGTIEIAPLAYMRGRTLDDSFIILDEAQNTTPEQMKMFLTRLGSKSKAVVTGDITQTDLPFGKSSGLIEAIKILDGIDDIYIHQFTERDVVRHKLVQKIILAYERHDKEKHTKRDKQQKAERVDRQKKYFRVKKDAK